MIVTFKTIPSRINTIENVIKHYESYNFVKKIIIKIDNFNELEQKKTQTPLFLKKYKKVVIQKFDNDLGAIQKYFVSQSNVSDFIFICDDDAMVDLNFANKFNFNKNYLYMNKNNIWSYYLLPFRNIKKHGFLYTFNNYGIRLIIKWFMKLPLMFIYDVLLKNNYFVSQGLGGLIAHSDNLILIEKKVLDLVNRNNRLLVLISDDIIFSVLSNEFFSKKLFFETTKKNIIFERSLSADGLNFKRNSQSIKYVSTDFKKISI